jgi:hypothetical protein
VEVEQEHHQLRDSAASEQKQYEAEQDDRFENSWQLPL